MFCFIESHNSAYNLESHLVLIFVLFVFTMFLKDWVGRELLAEGVRKLSLHKRKLVCVLGISHTRRVSGPR